MRLHVAVAGMADMLARLLRCEGAGGALPGAALVDPQIAHDPIHPAIQSRSRLPLIACLERLFQRRLERDWIAGCIGRSEEHTSELQSLMRISYAVFCLKKKKQKKKTNRTSIQTKTTK